MAGPTPPLAAHYDALWDESAPLVRAGRATLDPWARRKAEDARRGVTLLARPSAEAAARLGTLRDELRALEPAQYHQPVAELHHTVLSLHTATPDHARYRDRIPAYRAAVAEVAAALPPFAIDVRGVTLSPAAVLARGFPRDGTLEALRDALRATLGARGVGDTLDQRYLLVTAHLTLVRFTEPLRDPARFVDALAAARDRDLGTTRVARVELVASDWYHTAEREERLGAFALGGSAPDDAAS